MISRLKVLLINTITLIRTALAWLACIVVVIRLALPWMIISIIN